MGVSHQEVTPLNFCDKGVKTGVRVYQEDVLQGVLKPLNTTLFYDQKWVFQQDSAPAHKAMTNRLAAEVHSGINQHRGLTVGESRTQPPGLYTVGCFGRQAKAS